MEKFKIIFLFFALTLIGLSSCQNEKIDISVPEQTAATDKKRAFDPKPVQNDDVYAKLRAFEEKIRSYQTNTSLRDASTMPVSQVVWNIEAYLNAAYGHSDKPFADQRVQQDSFRVSVTNGEVNGADVLSTLASAKGLVIEQYRKVSSGGKHIVFVDIASKAISASQLQFTVSSFIGLNSLQVRTDPYTSTDNWKFGFKLGRCNGTRVGEDAATRLNEELNVRYIVPPTVINPVHMYFTDIDFVFITALNLETPNDVDDNIRDKLLYFSTEHLPDNFSTCVGFQDMNWYYNNIYNLVSNTSPSGIRPSGKYFVSSELEADAISRDFKSTLFHKGLIGFGIPHFCWVSSPCDPMLDCFLDCD